MWPMAALGTGIGEVVSQVSGTNENLSVAQKYPMAILLSLPLDMGVRVGERKFS